MSSASKYQKSYAIPEAFPELLKGFAREALRNQPADIYEFGAIYFSKLVEERRQAALQAELNANAMGADDDGDLGDALSRPLSDGELQDKIFELFIAADVDESGFLDRKELATVLRMPQFGLTRSQVRQVMAEADENEDGVIEYREFLPLMVGIITAFSARDIAVEERDAYDDEVRAEVRESLLRGYTREEVCETLMSLFRAVDTDDSGTLSRHEFKMCLLDSEIGLSRRDINVILTEADIDGNEQIGYEEFIPVCFNVLIERFKMEIIQNQNLTSPDTMTQILIEYFQSADFGGSLQIPLKAVKSALKQFSREILGLTKVQIIAIMSETQPDASGLVSYVEFASTAARMIYSMIDSSAQASRLQGIDLLAQTSTAELLHGLDEDTVMEVIGEAFIRADTDGNGFLDREEMVNVITSFANSDLALTPQEVRALIAAVDEDEDGHVTYKELTTFMLEVLVHISKEEYIRSKAFTAEVERLGEDVVDGDLNVLEGTEGANLGDEMDAEDDTAAAAAGEEEATAEAIGDDEGGAADVSADATGADGGVDAAAEDGGVLSADTGEPEGSPEPHPLIQI